MADLSTHCRSLKTLKKMPFEDIVEKGEYSGNQHFLIFPQYFYHIKDTVYNLSHL